MFNVLFIDDDSFMLRALLRMAKRLRPQWRFLTEENAANWSQALLQPEKLHLVVCDYLMPVINGDKVLSEVAKIHPEAIRALLTGDTTEGVMYDAGKSAHFVLSKPFEEQHIVHMFTCVERVHALPFADDLRAMLGRSALIVPLPGIVEQVRKTLQNEQFEVADLVDIIAHEPVITARLLQLANSAFLGFGRPTMLIEEAIKRLGLTLTSTIITSTALQQASATMLDKAEHSRINDYAYNLAVNTRPLCKLFGVSKSVQDELFVAALLSAVGELIVATTIWQDSYAVLFANWSSRKLTSVISVYLLTLWGYRESLCHTLLWSAEPDLVYSKQNTSLLLFLAKHYTDGEGKIPEAVLNALPDRVLRQKLYALQIPAQQLQY